MSRERILVVRLAALGDIVMTSVLLSRIRAELPGAHVTWVCGSGVKPLVELLDVDEIVAVDSARMFRGGQLGRLRELATAWRALRFGAPYDRIFIAHADARYRMLVPLAGRASVRMLEPAETRAMNPIPGRYFGDECARLLDEPGNRGPIARRYAPADVRARLRGNQARSSRPMVVLVPGGARNVLREDAVRRWPAERYRVVADELVALGCEVVLVGDTGDVWVREHFDGSRVQDRIGALSIPETLAVMRDAALVISHDTGPLHLARLVRAPVLALFGPTMPSRFVAADDESTKVLWGGADLACRPCYDGREFAACSHNACMHDIAVADVLRLASGMLQHRFSSSPQPVSVVS